MAKSAYSEYRHHIASSCTAVPKGVIGGYSCAHHRRRLHCRKIVRNWQQGFGRDCHIVGIAAIVGNAGYLCACACDKITMPAGIAVAAMPPMPADRHPLSRLPSGNLCPLHQQRLQFRGLEPAGTVCPETTPLW
jgi:hypothetical protein